MMRRKKESCRRHPGRLDITETPNRKNTAQQFCRRVAQGMEEELFKPGYAKDLVFYLLISR